MVYPLLQVTTLAVYVYFVASLMGNQYLDPSKGYPTHPIDLVIPIFTFLQVGKYLGIPETLYTYIHIFFSVFLLHGLVNGSRNFGEPLWRRRRRF